MSIILKGINMPKSCGECQFETAQYVNNYCRKAFCSLGADFEHCPLIEIPTPHGRLIDRDDIYIGRWDIDTDLAEQIQNAPTILEAEDEKAYTIQADSDTVSFKNNGENQF